MLPPLQKVQVGEEPLIYAVTERALRCFLNFDRNHLAKHRWIVAILF
jgi:hypothetical protein